MAFARRRAYALALLAGTALFLGLAAPRLSVPAPSFLEGMHVLPAVSLLRGRSVRRDMWISAGGGERPLFLALNEYNGSLETYPLLALFEVFGCRPALWRAFALALAALAWLAFAWMCLEAFGERCSLVAFALLVTQPALLLAARAGLENEFSILCLAAGVGLAAYFRWQRTGEDRWARLAAFALGVGTWEKLVLLQASAALLLAHALLSRRRLPRSCAAWWLLGASPLLLENVVRPLCTPRFIWEMLRAPAQGAGNGEYVSNLVLRLRHLAAAAAPGARSDALDAFPAALALAPLAAALVPAVRRRLSRPWALLAAFLALFTALSAVNGTGLRPYHVQPAVPACLALSAAVLSLLPTRWLAPALAAALALQAGAFRSRLDWEARTGGRGPSSVALYDLVAHCRAAGVRQVVAVRGAVTENLEAASAGDVAPLDASRFPESDWERWLARPATLYVLAAPDQFAARPLDAGKDFEGFARARGLSFSPVRVFANREGRPVYTLAALARASAATASR